MSTSYLMDAWGHLGFRPVANGMVQTPFEYLTSIEHEQASRASGTARMDASDADLRSMEEIAWRAMGIAHRLRLQKVAPDAGARDPKAIEIARRAQASKDFAEGLASWQGFRSAQRTDADDRRYLGSPERAPGAECWSVPITSREGIEVPRVECRIKNPDERTNRRLDMSNCNCKTTKLDSLSTTEHPVAAARRRNLARAQGLAFRGDSRTGPGIEDEERRRRRRSADEDEPMMTDDEFLRAYARAWEIEDKDERSTVLGRLLAHATARQVDLARTVGPSKRESVRAELRVDASHPVAKARSANHGRMVAMSGTSAPPRSTMHSDSRGEHPVTRARRLDRERARAGK